MQLQQKNLQIAGFLVVALSMVEMFTIPRSYFATASIVSTLTMVCVAFLLRRIDKPAKFSTRNLAVGIVTAIVLYSIFFLGNALIKNYGPFGIRPINETSIYDLFSSTPIPLLIVIFFFDAIGFESYFRGNLQRLFYGKLRFGAIFLPALIDALIHFSSFNPLFPATTFIVDCFWGVNYYFTKDIYSNYTSHFVWDLLIFLVFPIH